MFVSRKSIVQFTTVLLLLINTVQLSAQVHPAKYGLADFSDSVKLEITGKVVHSMDSVFKAHPQLNNKNVVNAIAQARFHDDKTYDFYLVISLILALGLIRLADPRYFQTLWQAFRNPVSANRHIKEKLQSASVSNLLMNMFFAISAGTYGFFIVKNFMPQRSGDMPPSLLLALLIAGMITIYTSKYAVIRFSGWAFRVEGITEDYLFNVFLVNKILAIILLPIIVLLAFTDLTIAQPALIISFLLIIILFVNRYLRSWHVFGSFFQYSKFHFFTYLCASELLPLAVLMKLLVRGLLY